MFQKQIISKSLYSFLLCVSGAVFLIVVLQSFPVCCGFMEGFPVH